MSSDKLRLSEQEILFFFFGYLYMDVLVLISQDVAFTWKTWLVLSLCVIQFQESSFWSTACRFHFDSWTSRELSFAEWNCCLKAAACIWAGPTHTFRVVIQAQYTTDNTSGRESSRLCVCVKLLIYCSASDPTLTCGHEIWPVANTDYEYKGLKRAFLHSHPHGTDHSQQQQHLLTYGIPFNVLYDTFRKSEIE